METPVRSSVLPPQRGGAGTADYGVAPVGSEDWLSARKSIYVLLQSSDEVDITAADTLLRSFPSSWLDTLGQSLWPEIAQLYKEEVRAATRTAAASSSSSSSYTLPPEHVEGWLNAITMLQQRFRRVTGPFRSSHAILFTCVALAHQECIAAHADAIVARIRIDLSEKRQRSLCHVCMHALGMDDRWRLLMSEAASLLVASRATGFGQGDFSPGHETFGTAASDITGATPFDVAALPQLLTWLQHDVFPTLEAWGPNHLESLAAQLHYEAHIALGQLRARQLFDIISDFPASSPSLHDLVVCADNVDLKPYVSSQLNYALHTRLLHPGASTQDIIQFYTHLIRSLRFVDPSGVILSHVIGPVRTYLRARADTVPVIVASLLGHAGEFTLLRDLMRESTNAPGLGSGVGDSSVALYDDADEPDLTDLAAMDDSKRLVFIPPPDEDWAPRPTDAGPDYRQSRKSDVVAIVASIFEDEEGFIAALEKSCADQFLRVRNYDTSQEYETNENLKKRFGDAWLNRCDVMLNDIKKSQRFDRSIHRGMQQVLPEDLSAQELGQHAANSLHPLILSRQFWPALKDDPSMPASSTRPGVPGTAAGVPSVMFASVPNAGSSRLSASTSRVPKGKIPATGVDAMAAAAFTATEMATAEMQMPGQMAAALDQYGVQFSKLAHGRRVRWLPGRGEVHVRLTMDDGRQIDEHVLPLQAAVVELAAGAAPTPPSPDGGVEKLAEGHVDGSRSPLPHTLVVAEAAAQLRVDARYVSEAAAFWATRGVLRESAPGTYAVVERA